MYLSQAKCTYELRSWYTRVETSIGSLPSSSIAIYLLLELFSFGSCSLHNLFNSLEVWRWWEREKEEDRGRGRKRERNREGERERQREREVCFVRV